MSRPPDSRPERVRPEIQLSMSSGAKVNPSERVDVWGAPSYDPPRGLQPLRLVVARNSAPFFEILSIRDRGEERLTRPEPAQRFAVDESDPMSVLLEAPIDRDHPVAITVRNVDTVPRHFHAVIWGNPTSTDGNVLYLDEWVASQWTDILLEERVPSRPDPEAG